MIIYKLAITNPRDDEFGSLVRQPLLKKKASVTRTGRPIRPREYGQTKSSLAICFVCRQTYFEAIGLWYSTRLWRITTGGLPIFEAWLKVIGPHNQNCIRSVKFIDSPYSTAGWYDKRIDEVDVMFKMVSYELDFYPRTMLLAARLVGHKYLKLLSNTEEGRLDGEKIVKDIDKIQAVAKKVGAIFDSNVISLDESAPVQEVFTSNHALSASVQRAYRRTRSMLENRNPSNY